MWTTPLPLHAHGLTGIPLWTSTQQWGRQVRKHALKMFIQGCATRKNKNSKKAQTGTTHTHIRIYTHTHMDK